MMNWMQRKMVWVMGAMAGFFMAGAASGELIIQVGDRVLLPDTPDQVIEIFVTGGDPIGAVNLRLQINDGQSGPVITDVDLVTGTIFERSNPFLTVPPGAPQLLERGAAAGFGAVDGEGLLATVTISTVGITDSGTFELNLNPPALGNTELIDANTFTPLPIDSPDPVTIQIQSANGIPEPMGVLVWAVLSGVCLIGPRRR